jgi:cytochrome c
MTRHSMTMARAMFALVFAGAALTGHAADLKVGADLFAENCAECHSLKEGKQKKGPSLFAVYGRKAGQQADFSYSDAMKASSLSWTPEALDAYLTLPKKAVPGGKMKFDGLPDAKERANVIAFLASVK